MSQRPIRTILTGLGMVGSFMIENTWQRGVEILAAFDIKEELIGREIGEILQIPELHGKIYHIDDLPEYLDKNKVDLAIFTPEAPTERTLPQIRTVLSHGISILTSLADTYVMRVHFPEMFRELDALAKENGATYFASGIQDVFWTALPVALTGSCLDISEIKGTNIALIDYFGPGVADECYVGWDLDKFEAARSAGTLPTNDFLIALYELVEKLGLHAVSEESSIEPLLAKKDTYYETIDRHVKAGQLLGNYVESRIGTREGINIVCDFVSKMSEEGDTDLNKWEITGNPTINVITERMQGEITTGSNMINRIPDVLNAPAGVIAASEMSAPFYKPGDLSAYVK